MLAILLIYRQKISFKEKWLWTKIILSFLPIGVIGFIFADFIKSFFQVKIVAIMFILGGIILLLAEKIYQKRKKENIKQLADISFRDAFKIGLFQVFALIPGTSRSGATILAAW